MKFPGILRPARVAFLIGLAVFLLGGVLWRAGLFQSPELWCYDHFVRWNSNPSATDSRIILVLLTEDDIKAMDYPLKDDVLSEVLEKIDAGNPSVIGVDLYRDLPEPRDHSKIGVLNDTLKKHQNIVSIFLFDTPEDPYLIAPPKIVQDDPSRFGFNNFPDTKIIRRAYLLWPWGSNYKNSSPYYSFPLLLAQYYFADHNIDVAQEGDNLRLGRTIVPGIGKDDGGYVNTLPGGYAFLQDFRCPWKFESLSISDVLALKDASVFKGRIVLLGIEAGSSNDTFTTPLSPKQNPVNPNSSSNAAPDTVAGVELHAEIVNQLLRIAINGENPTAWFRPWFGWTLLAVWGVFGVLAGLYTKSHHLFALTVVICLGLIAGTGWLFYVHGYWILVFAPAAVFVATAMLVKGYAVTYGEEEKQQLKQLFSQRVNPEVAEYIYNNSDTFLEGGRPAATKLVVTALFTDLKNYSTISEGMTPTELIAWVNDTQAALTKHVRKNNGMVLCFMGDGMMATYGAPVPRMTEEERANDAVNAVRSALAMGGEIRRMNVKWRKAGKPLAGLRIGIFTGEAVGGDIGTHEYVEYSVIGDTINTASRLESVDKEGTMTKAGAEVRILIGARTNQYVSNQFPTRHVGSLALKGKTETTEIYKVLDSEDEPEQTNKVS